MTSTTEPVRRSWLGSAVRIGFSVLAIVLVLVIAVIVWLLSPAGLGFVVGQAQGIVASTNGTLNTEEVSGSLWGGVTMSGLRWSDGNMTVSANDVVTDWSLGQLLTRRLVIKRLQAGQIRVLLPPPEADPPPRQAVPMPGSLAIPIAIEIRQLSLASVTLVAATSSVDKAAASKPPEPIVLEDLALSFLYEQGRYQVDGLGIDSPWGTLTNANLTMGDEAPHAIELRAGLAGQVEAATYDLKLRAWGDLEQFSLSVGGTALASAIQFNASIEPLSLSPLMAADLTLKQLALTEIDPALPETALDISVQLRTLGANLEPLERWRISLDITNQVAGALEKKRVPVTALKLAALISNPMTGPLNDIRLQAIEMRLPTSGGKTEARVTGDLELKLDEQQQIAGSSIPVVLANLEVLALDVAQFASSELATALSGQVRVSREQFEIDLKQTTRPGQPNAEVSASLLASLPTGEAVIRFIGQIDGDRLKLNEARVALGPTELSASGSAQLVTPFDLALKGRIAKLNIDQWIPKSVAIEPRWREGMINAKWDVTGRVEPAPVFRLAVQLDSSRLAGQPLIADVKAGVRLLANGQLGGLEAVNLELGFGKNRVTVVGDLGSTTSESAKPTGAGKPGTLKFRAALSDPAVIDPRARGSIKLNGQVTGQIDSLRLSAKLDGRRLRFTPVGGDAVSVATMGLSAAIPIALPLAPDAPIKLKATVSGLSVAGQKIAKTQLSLDGSAGEHQIVFDTKVAGQSLALRASGRADLQEQPSWRGKIDSLRSDGKIRLRSLRATPLFASAQRVELNDLELSVSSPGGQRGKARVEQLNLALGESPQFKLIGQLQQLAVAQLASSFQAESLPVELQNLRLNSRFDLSGSGAQDLSGELTVSLQEIKVGKKKLGLAGRNEAEFRFDAGQINGDIDLTLPSLAFTRRLTGPGWVVDGVAGLAGVVSGTISKPRYTVQVKVTELSLLQPALGWRLDQGAMRAEISNQSIKIKTLRLNSGEGVVEMTGGARLLAPGSAAAKASKLPLDGAFNLNTDRFVVPIGPGQRLVLSGKTRLVVNQQGLSWMGDMKADEGLIEIAGSGAPSLPDDVQIVEKEPPQPKLVEPKADGAEEEGISVLTLLNINLGENLRVQGGGVNARLVGSLQLKGNLPADPRAEGLVKIVDGSYTAYSQDLEINGGDVRFNGPIDNPALNIEALRPKLPVTVGVAIRGTALSPRIELFSDPSMSDAEKLSWLVLGVPIENAQAGAQSLALKEAASLLLGQDDGSVSGGSFSDKIGLDSLGFGYASDTGQSEAVRDSGSPTGLPGAGGQTSASASQEVVTLGKKLTDRLTISYEQSVRGLYNLLRVQYEINKRLSLRAQTGSESAVDLLYFWSFD